jgi:hypothetical protein
VTTTRKNWNCDGDQCTDPKGETRVYPLGSGGNLILCLSCFAHENKARHLKGRYYGRPEEWPQVNWADAKRYPEDAA